MTKLLGISDSPNALLMPKRPPTKICKDQVLKRLNYLSEFLTKSEKLKVLENLGIDFILKFADEDSGIITKDQLIAILDEYLRKEGSEDSPLNVNYLRYDNSDYPNITTVKQALDQILYKDLVISLTVSPNIAKKGSQVSEVTISWTYNKDIVSQTFYSDLYPGGITLEPDIRYFKLTSPVSEDHTFKVVGSDGVNAVEAKGMINFYNAIYYGSGSELPVYSAMGYKVSRTKVCQLTVNASANQYIWIYLPKEYGTPKFTVGGFEGGFQQVGEDSIDDIQYALWRSDNHSLGNTTINIS